MNFCEPPSQFLHFMSFSYGRGPSVLTQSTVVDSDRSLSRALHHPVGTAGVAGCVDARSAASYVECGGTVRSRWQTCQSVLPYIKIYLLKLSMKSEKLSMKSEK